MGTDAEETAPEPKPGPQAEEQVVLDKAAFKASFDDEEVEVLHGCRIGPVSRADYAQIQRLPVTVMQAKKGTDAREVEFKLATEACWLAFGVREPVMDWREWRTLLDRKGGAGKLGDLVTRVQELSGVTPMEVELAKKALPGILAGLLNLESPPDSSGDTQQS